MSSDDTIAAVATPLGPGGLGVVRLSGPDAIAVADKIFRSTRPLSEALSHTVHHGTVRDGDTALDDVLASVFRSPRSYTGEDTVEISCHGGPFVVKSVLTLCFRAGARPAEPGEFSKRAFLNGKLDLAQAEAVGELIAAHSESFRRLAMEQMQGRLSVYLKDLRRRLVDLLALLEANLDFAEDEVPDLSKDDLRAGLDRLLQEGTALLHTASRGRLLRDGLRAVLVGSPNVGKSSLFNALLGHDRAIVTEVPGTTRDTLEERFLADDVPVTVTDTAGLRTETDRVEGAGIARAKRALEQADVALFVLDASRPLSEEDRAVAALLDGKKIVLALNKWDRAGKETAHHLRAPLPLPPKTPCLKTCALDGRGVNELRRELVRVMDDRSPETADVPTLINLRHAELLNDAVNHLKAARRSAESSLHEECLAIDMRLALGGLNQITGEGVHDEILDAIFSKFCVGK